jgi:RNA polymerase sigma-70 factor (ECF subfamily)
MISSEEIERAYNNHSVEIFSYILRSVRDRDSAEDLLQDVFVRLIRYSEKREVHGDNIRALLYSIARTVMIDTARKPAMIRMEMSDIDNLSDRDSIETKDSSEPAIERISHLVDALGEPEKSIILFRQSGLTYAEISGIMKISERTLKRKTKNSIAYIRKTLQSEGFFISGGTSGHEDPFNSQDNRDE